MAGLGSGGVKGKPDVEKRQVVTETTMILPGETEAGTAGTQPCRGIAQWAHRDDERGREDSFLRRPNTHRIEKPNALKILARREEYSLTENVASPFRAEPAQFLFDRTKSQNVLLTIP